MAYNEKLADRVRDRLELLPNLEEKFNNGGLAFIYNGQMCLGVINDELLCRIDPSEYDMALEQRGCRPMDITGSTVKDYVMVDETGMRTQKEFDRWINLALDFNTKERSVKDYA